ncbi:peptidoglycan hydrolase CwlO-like protein [Ezakiella coagulans]|uniref:Peptidoglycan hydrolase CwlO-like protein n=1 Tax=Ezakiella coagulans TaxID=46507 RepID=A0A2U1E6P8_9FIRM|nr:S-layer homology domain-containing protein [Ezakiella coagulans]PVY95532.1 peptidoglycan hydrolase CwlO-like protein [Ezakiella coagulans]
MRKLISILIAVMMVLTLLPVGRVMAEGEELATAKEALNAKITEAKEELTKYEDGDAKTAFTQAIQAAVTVYEKTDATLDDVNAETTKLTEAIKTFKDAVKKAEEEAKLKEAKSNAEKDINNLTNLTNEEKAPFLQQVKDAATIEAVNAVVEAAKKADELVEAKKALKAKIDAAKAVKDTDAYINATKDKQDAFDKAITDAKTELDSATATAETLKKVETKLEEAQKALGKKEENPTPGKTPEQKLADAKEALKVIIAAAEKAKDTDAYKNATKATKDAFEKALEAAKKALAKEGVKADELTKEGTALKTAQDALDGKTTTPVVPSDSYSTRVPRAIRTTIANANAMMKHPDYWRASNSSKAALESSLKTLKSIANDFENGYYNKYWNGKFWNGYYGDGWYDYYENGYYYRNGLPYEYFEFKNTFGDYPRYDLSDGYYGRRYLNGKYRRGYYRDGWYDYYDGVYYYRDGVPYDYYEFKREFGYYPSYAYGRGYWNEYDGTWDPHYGYQGRYGYYNSTIRNAVESTVDAINAVANESGAKYMTASYPSLSDYEGYYDYYPWYYDPYYYDGYYYDQSSSKVRELKKLIGEAEELAASRSDAQWAPYRSELTDAANYGRKAAKGRASVKGAIEELEKAIKKAKTDGMKLYIRRGFMTGVNGMEFNPNGTLTRAEMAQIIENLLEQSGETVAFAPKKFNDVESGRWFKKAVNLISSHNIMKGNPDGNFYPQKPVSIEELIVIAARLGGHTPQTGNVFGISKHYWSVPYIQTAYVKGWIGMDKFDPSAAITRGQAVQILNRSLNYGVDKEFINKYGAQMNQFSDVSMSNPYYYDIIAATNTISYSQVPNSRTRIWRAFQTSGGWSTSKYSNGTYVKPYTGW